MNPAGILFGPNTNLSVPAPSLLPQLLVLALAQIGGLTRLQQMTTLTESVFLVSLLLLNLNQEAWLMWLT